MGTSDSHPDITKSSTTNSEFMTICDHYDLLDVYHVTYAIAISDIMYA